MAGVVIVASVSGGGGPSISDDLDQIVSDAGYELVIVRGPHPCGPCEANRDPHQIPFPGCDGNLARREGDEPDGDADDAKDVLKGNLCQCRTRLVRKDEVAGVDDENPVHDL